MKHTLTKKQLISLYSKFECEEWKKNISEILSSNLLALDNTEIVIDSKYLNLLNENGSKKQKEAIIAFGLKINEPEDAKQFLIDSLNGCTIRFEKNIISIFFDKDGKTLFVLDHENNHFLVCYTNIWLVFKEKYDDNYKLFKELLTTILEEHLNLKGYTPSVRWFHWMIPLEEHLNLKGYTSERVKLNFYP